MDAHQNSARFQVTAYILVGCVIGFMLANFVPLMIEGTAEASANASSKGLHEQDATTVKNVILTYSYETSPSSTAGDKSLAVDSIEFFPNYVLVSASNGSTSLFAVERLRQFSYRPAASK